MHKVLFPAILFAIICLLSCKEEKVYIPKARIYPKIEFPERKMSNFHTDFCSFTFEHPDYMKFEQDTLFIHRDAPHSCWFNLTFPGLNGTIHFTYTDLKKCDTLSVCLHKVYNDAYKMAQEHVPKANALEDFVINNPEKNVYGVLFNIEGHVASPFQIVMTDSVIMQLEQHYISIPDRRPIQWLPLLNLLKKILCTFLTVLNGISSKNNFL